MLTTRQFEYVAQLVHRVAGIRLGAGKEGLVQARLTKRVTALGLDSMSDYIELVQSGADAELSNLVDVLTTNKTSFYREPAHFTYMRERLVPAWRERGGPIRVWSAGCSTGEEPYTLAMELHDTLGTDAARVRILATDVSTTVLARARRGHYPATALADVGDDRLRRHFRRQPDGTHSVTERVRSAVSFARLNLMEPWPMRGLFDLIVCRNVMIYFDNATQERLIARFAQLLEPGGHLFVGHSESLGAFRHEFTYVQPAIYAR